VNFTIFNTGDNPEFVEAYIAPRFVIEKSKIELDFSS